MAEQNVSNHTVGHIWNEINGGYGNDCIADYFSLKAKGESLHNFWEERRMKEAAIEKVTYYFNLFTRDLVGVVNSPDDLLSQMVQIRKEQLHIVDSENNG